MTQKPGSHFLTVLLLPFWVAGLHADTLTWDGGGGDGNWKTAANWDGDVVPASGDTVNIGAGETVTFDGGGNLPGGITLNLDGTLTNAGQGAIRLAGATLVVGALGVLDGDFWDLNNATITLENGANATMANWEHKGTNVFNFNLGATGFFPLTPGTLWIGGGGTIADATYNVDMAAYTGGRAVITLMDFNGDTTGMDDAIFQGAGGLNILNPPAGFTTSLRWVDSTDTLELVVDAPIAWTNGNGDGLWKTAGNWDTGEVPVAGDEVVIDAGDTVIWDGGNLPRGIDLELNGILTNAGQGAMRLNASTITVGATGEIAGAFWDLDEAGITFVDGAKFTAANWENKDGNAFTFVLGESGFTTLTPGTFRIGNGNVHNPGDIANASYTADMSAYTGGAGVITLVDYGSDAASMDDTKFQTATLNVIAPVGYTANLQWNDVEESIELNITAAPSSAVPNIIAITRDGSGNVTLTLDGSEAGLTVQQSDDLSPESFSDVASTPGTNTLTVAAANAGGDTSFFRLRN